ncbi:MAG: YifB family Mg chelatase-like AAA ATPase [Candidatus Pacebacteria bacterium]|nr:YifB family Mg chelatase-like AAA ATPase [Candidatus Paceibacterota bacterium]
MLATVSSAAVFGIEALPVFIEIEVSSRGLPGVTVVGLPHASVKESKDRVRSALRSCGFQYRAQKVTINLSPAWIPKHGPSFDLPIALGLLQGYNLLPPLSSQTLIAGELSLDGTIRPISGILPIIIMAAQRGYTHLFIPTENENQCMMTSSVTCYAASHLRDIVLHITGKRKLSPVVHTKTIPPYSTSLDLLQSFSGQEHALRTAQIAAAGRHHTLFIGPPGVGKTMLAHGISSLLPPLDNDEYLEVSAIQSRSPTQLLPPRQPPFRAPHARSTTLQMFGGGHSLLPGELTFAHRGVLFLDELPAFSSEILQGLRIPLEEHVLRHSVEGHTLEFPCRFLFLAAMNPCPCGYAYSMDHVCTCSPSKIRQYLHRISSPLLDRIDLQVTLHDFSPGQNAPGSDIESRVSSIQQAWNIQQTRYKNTQNTANGELTSKNITQYCPLSHEVSAYLRICLEKLKISHRKYVSIIRVARTIADLETQKNIEKRHIAEAVQSCVRIE